ncbi:hypothetical protein V1514DRAFT_352094 [Lipomyces japonicus]|uniref:uncharacterized protein n=1 Tax=Lipomyces japonicus TaxID=56871 RepID=UPI0034CFB9DE
MSSTTTRSRAAAAAAGGGESDVADEELRGQNAFLMQQATELQARLNQQPSVPLQIGPVVEEVVPSPTPTASASFEKSGPSFTKPPFENYYGNLQDNPLEWIEYAEIAFLVNEIPERRWVPISTLTLKGKAFYMADFDESRHSQEMWTKIQKLRGTIHDRRTYEASVNSFVVPSQKLPEDFCSYDILHQAFSEMFPPQAAAMIAVLNPRDRTSLLVAGKSALLMLQTSGTSNRKEARFTLSKSSNLKKTETVQVVEVQDRRKPRVRDSCFTCGERGHYAKDCPKKKKVSQRESEESINNLEESVIDPFDTETGEEVLRILHAVDEENNVDAIEIASPNGSPLYGVRLEGRKYQALFDIGSHRNFLDPSKVDLMYAKVREIPPIVVRLAGGTQQVVVNSATELMMEVGTVSVGRVPFLLMSGTNHPVLIGRSWMARFEVGLS